MNINPSVVGRLKTWSTRGISKRIYTILSHYGISPKKLNKTLFDFYYLLKKYDVTPTFPVTATVLNRKPIIFKKLQDLGVEFAVHGYRHVDYTQLYPEDVGQHLSEAVAIFNQNGIRFSGYRYPYLRRDDERLKILKEYGFKWDSSEVIDWDVLDKNLFPIKTWNNYLKILETYQAEGRDTIPSLPFVNHGMIEIPVSIPDDDILIERLGIADHRFITNIWEAVVKKIRENEELFVVQAHPERFTQFKESVEQIVKTALSYGDIWMVPLGEIAAWWQERENLTFSITKLKKNRVRIVTSCSDRFNIQLAGKNHHQLMPQKENQKWEVNCTLRPVIGLSSNPSMELTRFLKQEGFFYEIGQNPKKVAYFIPEIKELELSQKNRILNDIHQCPHPIVQYSRWPKGYRGCMAITGDIDGLDIWDILERYHG